MGNISIHTCFNLLTWRWRPVISSSKSMGSMRNWISSDPPTGRVLSPSLKSIPKDMIWYQFKGNWIVKMAWEEKRPTLIGKGQRRRRKNQPCGNWRPLKKEKPKSSERKSKFDYMGRRWSGFLFYILNEGMNYIHYLQEMWPTAFSCWVKSY